MTESAQVFKGVHDTPNYTDIFFNKPMRLWVAIPLGLGTTATVVSTVLLLNSGYVRAVFIWGVLLTALTAGIGAIIPHRRPSLQFRARSLWRTLRPRTRSSADTSILAPPREVIGNLSFTEHGVYAHFLLSGLRYYLQPTKNRLGVAERHVTLSRELPSGPWIYGLEVPQDQRQLLRAMLHGHRDKYDWVTACQHMQATLAAENPRTRIFWLSIPVDAGRAGHSPTGQLTKVGDWLAGRDKNSDSSLQAYHRLAEDVITALPEEFAPIPATDEMVDWFWRHNAFRGVYTNPLPRRRAAGRLSGDQLPLAQFDDGDQANRPARSWWLRWIPSFKKVLRVSSPQGVHPDSYQAILPVVDMPSQGIAFPGSEILAALDDLDTGATFDFAIPLVMRSRDMETVRNDRAKENINEQFYMRRDARDGDAELRRTGRQLAEYQRLLATNTDERPLETGFFIAIGAADEHTVDYSIKRLREELSGSGQVVVRYYRGAQQRLWAAFNPGVAHHKSSVEEFLYPTTTRKWSRFVPITSSQVGNSTGVLLGFNQSNALNSAVLIDLPAAARRNHNPCLVCGGAPGYGKSYAAKRIARAEIQRGAQGFIVDPDIAEWADALADIPNKAIIDMGGSEFGCCPLRLFPEKVAGGYWLDYMVPMMQLDSRSTAVQRLRTLLTIQARRRLGITSTASLMNYLASIQAPQEGPDTRPAHVAQLAADLQPVLVALQSWATYDFTQAIFDDTLPVPDLNALDVTIWLTSSLDLPDAEEMSTPHLYEALSDRKKASVAIYGMLVRLARITFFANKNRFGLIVLEEAGALLNSRAGASDAHLISRRARKHYTGLVIITQDPVADLKLMGDKFITQQLIMPFESDELAKEVARRAGIRVEDYDDIEEYFLAEPSPEHMRDPTAFDDDELTTVTPAGASSRGDREGYGFFVDEFRRPAPIRVAAEPDPVLHAAYDTTPGRAAA
ncbi:ATP-binding protein [Mycobacterium sp. 29Ha]|uniref:ATP-binding protein n=1 Tax=Mycobacterium sp. 29Ha TaxID=2939268 RepID=UPI002939371D|nr:ATP-binding protein [Mycobacterium sp. 29Ha]MDV3133322.1 ATP-binding protein [Mycobacterium sp. 29Ha]